MWHLYDRGWSGYEYFISDSSGDYLWGIWHEETIYACGTAKAWVRQRTMKLFELLNVTQLDHLLLSDIRASIWGKTIEVSGELQTTSKDIQQFTLAFSNCSDILWNPPWDTVPNKLRLTQTYFALTYLPFRHKPFFAFSAEQLKMQFNYEQVIVTKT